MPKTAMNKKRFFLVWKVNVWCAGKMFAMQSVAITRTMKKRSDTFFRGRILVPNAGHVGAAYLR